MLVTARSAQVASTRGYLGDIRALQSRHLPLRIIQLKTGTRSNHLITCPHCGQQERDSDRNLPLTGNLVIITLIKLPKSVPSKAKKMQNITACCLKTRSYSTQTNSLKSGACLRISDKLKRHSFNDYYHTNEYYYTGCKLAVTNEVIYSSQSFYRRENTCYSKPGLK